MNNLILEFRDTSKQRLLAKPRTEDPTDPKNLTELNNRVADLFQTQPEIERDVQIQMSSIVSQMYKSALDSSDGYCYKFALPLTPVHGFFKKMKLTPAMVEKAFRADWKYPPNAHMYSDSYYQILLVLLYYGLHHNNRAFVNNSLLLILIKMWNGRRQKFFPFCNPATMKYHILFKVVEL